ncbi:PREDICTED: uncharacterized protein LOC109219811 [Nicotiana attenuata]|uniref:Uncharacterized protein n=1 Tax=Nicotiana attenuata TaxID=49451 RepID=A0A1J6JSJ5_NICAT|nr:PREDICTED: uncharacterized protein LOC109219811 [Nicotiana attenuata]OIT20714.1 hypothetical protein A4A49_39380 [Nicotiana attenuata]
MVALTGRSVPIPSMATAMSAIFVPPASPTSLASSNTPKINLSPWNDKFVIPNFFPFRSPKNQSRKPPSCSSTNGAAVQSNRNTTELPISVDALQRFIRLNLGNWTGSFHQFDGHGNLMHKITTKLAAGSYGEDELMSLLQTLYIKQPASTTSFSGDDYEQEWFEYKIKETNMFTVDKYQQIGFFPKEKAYALRYQTAGMLETVLRQGVLGEDDIGEESPRNLKLPSKKPSIVCENCLYSLEKDKRVRAFHIMDPKGILEMLLVFLEERGNGEVIPPSLDNFKEDSERINPHLGTWKGHSLTKRTGVYGATITEAETTAVLEMNKDGQLVQDITSTSGASNVTTNVHWTGTISENLVTFDGGFRLTLLPGGIYMGYPSDVANSVQESKSFHLELCWLESPGKRQRLIRTYDVEGLAVSSTYFIESKI